MDIIERIWEARDLIIQIAGMGVIAASMLIAGTNTPDPDSTLGRVYKLVEWAALNFGKAKDKGPEEQA